MADKSKEADKAERARKDAVEKYAPLVLAAVKAGNRKPESIATYLVTHHPAFGDEKQRDFAAGIAAALAYHVDAKAVEFNNDTKEYVCEQRKGRALPRSSPAVELTRVGRVRSIPGRIVA